MKRISILLCSEEEAADTFTFLRGGRSCLVLMRARAAAGYLFGFYILHRFFNGTATVHSKQTGSNWLGFGPAACSSEAAASREQVLQERFLSQGTNSALKKMLKIVLLLIILLCN